MNPRYPSRVAALIIVMLSVQTFSERSRGEPICHEASLANTFIICIRHGVGSFSAEDRALAIATRVQRLSNEQTFDTDKLTIVEQEASSDVMNGDQVIASVRDEDIDPHARISRQALAKSVVEKMKAAIAQDRKNRSPKELLHEIIYTVLTTLGLILFLIAASLIYSRIYNYIRNGTERFVPSLKIKSYEILTSQRLSDFLVWLVQASRLLVTIVAFYVYLPLVLSFFPATANFAPKLYGYVVDPLKSMFTVVLDYIPKLFFIVILILLTRYLLRIRSAPLPQLAIALRESS